MGAIDMLLTNGDMISKGFDVIRGIGHYQIATLNEEVICFSYQGDTGDALIKLYLKEKYIDLDDVEITKRSLKNKSDDLLNMIHKKLCVLDKKIVLYEEVVLQSKTKRIKGYKKDTLKNQFNVSKTGESK